MYTPAPTSSTHDIRVAMIMESAFTMALNGFYVTPLAMNESVSDFDTPDNFYKTVLESMDGLIETVVLLEDGKGTAEPAKTFGQKVKKFFHDLWENIKNIGRSIKKHVLNAFETVRGWIVSLINTIRSYFIRVVNWISNKFSGKDAISTEDKAAAKETLENGEKLIEGTKTIINDAIKQADTPEKKAQLQEFKGQIETTQFEIGGVLDAVSRVNVSTGESVPYVSQGKITPVASGRETEAVSELARETEAKLAADQEELQRQNRELVSMAEQLASGLGVKLTIRSKQYK